MGNGTNYVTASGAQAVIHRNGGEVIRGHAVSLKPLLEGML